MTSGVWRSVRVALLAAAALFTIAVVSWSSVLAQLATGAAELRTTWREHGAALRWNLAQPDSLVIPGSFGVGASDFRNDALELRFVTPDLDLSLASPAGSVPLDAIASAHLRLRSAHAISVWLIASGDAGGVYEASVTAVPGGFDGSIELQLPPRLASGERVSGLRLHLSGTPGQKITLHDLQLRARRTYDDRICPTSPDVAQTIARCASGPVRLVSPAFATPELLLTWRDHIQGAMLAVVEPPLPMRTTDGRARRLVSVAGMIIALTLLFVRWRRARRSSGNDPARSSDLVVIVPLCLLLWLGVGGPDTRTVDVVAFIACSVALWLLRAATAPPLVWSSAPGWRAAMRCTLLLAPLLMALLLANALDADGLRLRSIDLHRLWFYPLWALLQQYLIMHVLAPRTRSLAGDSATGALLAGLVFALLHTPNFGLMLATFIAGSLWAWVGYRQRALLPLAASHAVAGLLLVLLSPEWLLRSAEVGGRYLLPP